MNAVTEFLQVLEADPSSLASSRVTIISYDHTSNVNYDNAVPNSNFAKSIPFTAGGTNFDVPLRQALANMKQHEQKYKSIVLCMMTDGQASYPNAEVNQIKAVDFFGKITFKAVAYGGGSNELKRMATELGGEFVTALLA